MVWATLDKSKGRAAIKPFVVERDNPGLKLLRVEHKLGIRASDTANFALEDCRVPAADLLGSLGMLDVSIRRFGLGSVGLLAARRP